MDARGVHGLSCHRSGFRHQRHYQTNDILWTVIKTAQIPAVKEPASLLQQDGKWPDGATVLPWARGKPVAWDVIDPDTYAKSDLSQTSKDPGEPGAAAYKGSANKTAKYGGLSRSHIFLPVAVETAGTWGLLVQAVYRHITTVTENSRKTSFLFKHLSISLQMCSPSRANKNKNWNKNKVWKFVS